MAYCFDHSVIWSPNMSKIKQAYESGKSFFPPEYILELVARRRIQIMARERWYYKEERQKFQSSDWLDSIDSKLRDYAISDRDKPLYQKRVIIAPDAKGNEFAERIMCSTLKSDQDLVDFIRQQYIDKNIPYRIMNFIKKNAFTEEEAIRWILQNICNHSDAFRISKAQVPTMGEQPDIFLKHMEYSGINQSIGNISFKQVTAIMNSLRIILSLRGESLSLKKFKYLIEHNSCNDSLDDDLSKIAEYSSNNITTKYMLLKILSLVRNDIEQNKNKRDLTLSDYASIASLLLALISIIISTSIQSTISLFLNFPAIQSFKRVLGIGESSVKTNTSLPYLFVFGTSHPSLKKMEKLYDIINKELNK